MATVLAKESTLERVLRIFPPPKRLMMPAVGLDISDTSIRFLELKRRPRSWELTRYGSQAIPVGLVTEGEIQKPEELTAEFKKFREQYKLDYVRVSLPEERVYLFQTNIPSTIDDPAELYNTLEFQLEEHVPIPPHEAVFDYEVIDIAGDDMYVNVGVYPASVVEAYTEVLQNAGLKPVAFEIEAQSTARSVIPAAGGTYMIVDFGRTRTGFAVVSNGVLRFTSTVVVGGDTLTSAIHKVIPDLPEDQVTALKNERGILKSPENEELATAMMTTISALKDEIKRHYVYWNTRAHNQEYASKIDKIFLCGGSTNLAGLPEYLAFSLSIPVERANVWENVFSFDDVIPDISFRHSLGYATVIGLALGT